MLKLSILKAHKIFQPKSSSGGNHFIEFSTDDFKFAELPKPRNDFTDKIKSMSDMFTGQH